MVFQLGADPEVALIDSKGKYRAAYNSIPGSKEHPHEVDKGFFIHPDNVAAEFNFPPETTYEKFWGNAQRGMNYIKNATPHKIKVVEHAHFSEKELESPLAWQFGCKPDFNVWSLEPSKAEKLDSTIRVFGGHIHIGTDLNEYEQLYLAKYLDLTVGILDLHTNPQNPLIRKTHYGAFGSIRWKPYGIEYRTLSNQWLVNEDLRKNIWMAIKTFHSSPTSHIELLQEMEENGTPKYFLAHSWMKAANQKYHHLSELVQQPLLYPNSLIRNSFEKIRIKYYNTLTGASEKAQVYQATTNSILNSE